MGGVTVAGGTAGLDEAAREELRRALDRLEAGRGVIVRVADLMGSAVGGLTRLGARGLPGWIAGLRSAAGGTGGGADSVAAASGWRGRRAGVARLAGPRAAGFGRSQNEAPRGLALEVAAPTVGAPADRAASGAAALGALASSLQVRARGVAEAALGRAYDVAVLGLADGEAEPRRSGRRRRAAVIASGAVGGFVGMTGFVPDAMVTTLAIMREIAAIAGEEGEDLADEAARRACLEVFALRGVSALRGGPGPGGGSGLGGSAAAGGESELGYFSARLLLQGRPVMMLAREVAARYGVTLSRKFALQAVPVAGALTGAALNAAFLAHYRDLARAHFVIRRLERRFGMAAVREAAAR